MNPLFMADTTGSDSRSLPRGPGETTRSPTKPGNQAPPPSLTSGYGAVIEKEHDLQSATEGSFGHVTGEHASDIDRILRHQHVRLAANIALLEQRYEVLPKPERFVNWHDRGRPPARPRGTQRHETELLPDLIAQHGNLLADIETLIGLAPDGQHSEQILTEVSRNHEEMAWMLTALLKEDETAGRIEHDRKGDLATGTRRAQENWDNEGGPPAH